MTNISQVNIIGDADEATPETDPIDAADAKYWKMGIMTHDLKNLLPVESHEWQIIYKGGSRMPSEGILARKDFNSGYIFIPVNVRPWYKILGACTTTTGVHAITAIASGSLPSTTIRGESTGGTVAKYFSVTGNKVNSLSGLINCHSDYPVLSQTLGYTGFKNITPAHNAAHNGRKFPTDDGLMTGTEIMTPYQVDSNFVFHWDSAVDDVDYSTTLAHISYMVRENLSPGRVENQTDIETIDEGKYALSFTAQIQRGHDSSIYDDFIAGTKHNMYMTIFAGATNYQTVTWTDVMLTNCEANKAEGNEVPYWNVEGMALGISVSAKSGIAVGFYGE